MPIRRQKRKRITKRKRRVVYAAAGPISTAVSRSQIAARGPSIGFLPKGGLPNKLLTTFSYSDIWSMADTGVSGTAKYQQFRLTSIFDPDYSNGASNGQPYMRDQLSAFYNYAVIYAAKVVLCVVGDGTMTKSHLVVMRPTSSTSSPTDIRLESERPRAKTACLSDQMNKAVLKGYYPIHQLFGIKKSTLEDDQYRISIGSSPVNNVYLNILQSAMPTTDTGTQTLQYKINIKYYCKLYEYKDQVAS